jgi:broad specificity phosphatase PhoE
MFEAGPTPWDVEGRFVGSRPLPLTPEAVDTVRHVVDSLEPETVSGVYGPAANEACDQVARMIAEKFELRVRDVPELEAVGLGLWEALTYDEVRSRFPKAFKEWEEHPLAVTPPEGESTLDAMERVRNGLKRILRRNRGMTIALALRPMTMQIALGVLRAEDAATIESHLHQSQATATVELDLSQLKALIS